MTVKLCPNCKKNHYVRVGMKYCTNCEDVTKVLEIHRNGKVSEFVDEGSDYFWNFCHQPEFAGKMFLITYPYRKRARPEIWWFDNNPDIFGNTEIIPAEKTRLTTILKLLNRGKI